MQTRIEVIQGDTTVLIETLSVVEFAKPGPQGPQGGEGPQGVDGPQGPQGPQGADSDVPGPQGPQGPQGDTGPQGAEGPQGATGSQGPEGPQGAIGPQGVDGPQGPQGPDGPQGPQGAQGPEGPQGSQGPQGDTGAQGPQGPQGDDGPQGVDGPQGPQGATGAQGPDGPQGAQGPQGPQGDIGPQGPDGPQGSQGPEGPQGVDGPQGPQGDDGPQGPQGAQGPDGPQGSQGPQGAQGAEGPQGAQGPQGAEGPQGPQGEGVAPGGVEFNVLEKASGADFDTRWTNTPTVAGLQLDTVNPAADATGRIVWNDGDEVPAFISNGVRVDLGLETLARARNVTGSEIPKGTAVCIVGAAANRISIAPSDRTQPGSACRTLGVTLEAIPNNNFGKVSTFGLVRGLDTSAFSEGDELFVGATPGSLSATPPPPGERRLIVGYAVTINPSQGQLFVTLRRGLRVSEIDDTDIDTPADGETLVYDDGLWKNEQLTADDVGAIRLIEIDNTPTLATISFDSATGELSITSDP